MKTLQEDLKLFYLGIKKDNEPFLYKNKDLTTHATIVGMTGSGKTGLGITLLEEACIDNIPSIIIDPKGDMTNLCLAFPELKPSDFLPYIDTDEANSKGLSAEQMAEQTAKTWKKGIEGSYQSLDRISLFKNSADFRIYTPKSSVGISVSLLKDFVAPKDLNEEDLNNYIETISSSILSLLGINLQSQSSAEMLLLQNIFLHNFKLSKDLSMPELISEISKPPFSKIGVFDLEVFFPANKRMEFAMKLNALFASPSFSQWCVGERLDMSKMLFDGNGKARCNIFTISHLSDPERMFFVTLLLNEIIRWMRNTNGTSSLRAILYMDEIFGFFPPNANPPSKKPMLTLLKQARAYGVGVVLSMQNPVDLDYKGLSNMGTWFIGRLQTAQDKERIISGITGINGDDLSKNELLQMISGLDKRQFLVKNVHEDSLNVINTRFALSYLKGPISQQQISDLMKDKKITNVSNLKETLSSAKPVISPDITQIYSVSTLSALKPYLLGSAKVRYFTKDIDFTKDVKLCYALEDENKTDWDEASNNPNIPLTTDIKDMEEKFKYSTLPSYISSQKNLKDEEKNLKDYIYRNIKLDLFSSLGMNSNPSETKEEFMLRLHDKCNEVLEEQTTKFTAQYEKEKEKLEERLSKAEQKLQKEKSDVKSKIIDAAINIGSTILGGLFGGKIATRTNVGKVASGAKSASRVLNEKKDVDIAKEGVDKITGDIDTLMQEYDEKIKNLKSTYDLKNLKIDTVQISPKKSDIFDEKVVLLWKN